MNVAYRHVGSGNRLFVYEMVMGNVEEAEPVNERGAGWLRLNMFPNRQLFRFAVYRLSYVGERSVAIVNSKRLDSGMKFKNGRETVDVYELLRRSDGHLLS